MSVESYSILLFFCLFSFSVILRFILTLCVVHSLLFLSSIALYGYPIICLSAHLSIDISIVSSLGLLQIKS